MNVSVEVVIYLSKLILSDWDMSTDEIPFFEDTPEHNLFENFREKMLTTTDLIVISQN